MQRLSESETVKCTGRSADGRAGAPNLSYRNERNMYQRLNLTDYLFIVVILLLLTFSVSYGLRGWLLQVNQETTTRIEQAGRTYP